jgi:hypothetical protein
MTPRKGQFQKGNIPKRSKESYARAGRHFSETYKGTQKFTKNLGSGMKGKHHTIEARIQIGISNSIKQKGIPKPKNRKLLHKTDESKLARKSIEYKEWREKVFTRDNWTCRKCGKKGVRLHPHHIKHFSKFIELRFAVSNGITLCIDCHKLIHKKRILINQ